MAPRRRLAAALVVTGQAGHEIDGLRRALGAAALSRIPPHVTLVPPVNVRDEDVDSAVEVVRSAAARSRPLRLELGPIETFFPGAPVVYLSVGGDLDGLRTLRDALASGALAPPPRRHEREFVPHVTLDQRIAWQKIPSALETLSSYRTSVVLERVTLLEFLADDRRWVPLADAVLGPPSVIGRGGLEVELSLSTMLSPAASEFEHLAWQQYSEQAYGHGLPEDEPYAFTARVGGEIVGVATGQLRAGLCRLGVLIVSPEWRSHGVGSHLVRAVEHYARENGASSVRLETRADSRSVVFYEGLGYVATATLPAWRNGRDFLLMEHVLDS